MCAGAIVFFRIPKVVIAENLNYCGAENYLQAQGVEVVVQNDQQFVGLLKDFDRDHPGVWNKGE
jgi:cytosine deaminase